MTARSVSYKVKCRSCGREFIVPKQMALIPQHPVESKKTDFNIYLPCPGSGHTGIPVGTLHY